MSDLDRYMPQMMIPEIGVEGQKKIAAAKVLVVGAGGLGCPALLYLAGLGIGTIGIIDNDVVSNSNLHRQVLFTENEIGSLKVVRAKERLLKMNSSIKIDVFPFRLTEENAKQVMENYEVVIDCSDNIDTRYVIDEASHSLNKPFVYGGVRKFEGQVGVFNYKGSGSFVGTFPEKKLFTAEIDCASSGIVGYTAGIIGCMQVNEALKIILETGEILTDHIFSIDLQTMVMRKWKHG